MYEKIGIVGVGKIGSVLKSILENRGVEVVCVDKRFGELDYTKLAKCGLVFVLVNTTGNDCYFLDNIVEVLTNCKAHVNSPVVISSTCDPAFFKEGEFLVAANQLNVIYHPFFVTQTSIEKDILCPYFAIVGGDAGPVKKLYDQLNIQTTFYEMSWLEAAIVKTGFNAFLTAKLSLANLIGDLCVKEGLDPNKVLEAIAAAAPVNARYFQYGFGYGGPCLPIDNKLFQKTLAAAGINSQFPAVVDQTNNNHLDFQVEQFKLGADKNAVHSFKNVCYKTGSGILDHSQQLELAVRLAREGFKIQIEDEFAIDGVKSAYGDLFLYKSSVR